MILQEANLESRVVGLEKLFARVILIVTNLESLSKEIGFKVETVVTPLSLFWKFSAKGILRRLGFKWDMSVNPSTFSGNYLNSSIYVLTNNFRNYFLNLRK